MNSIEMFRFLPTVMLDITVIILFMQRTVTIASNQQVNKQTSRKYSDSIQAKTKTKKIHIDYFEPLYETIKKSVNHVQCMNGKK